MGDFSFFRSGESFRAGGLTTVNHEDRRRRASTNDESGRCTFCLILRREAEAYLVFEDETSFAFLDHRPLFPGHTLLATKRHYETLAELPRDLVLPLFSNVQLIDRAVVRATASEGSFVAINNRVSQSVPHLHVHVVPRNRGDGLKGFFWPRQRYKSKEAILDMQNAIRFAIAGLQASE